MNIILMGLPGAGKGTQAEKIVETYHIPQISTGDIFRQAMSDGTDLGKEARSYIDKGQLVPDEVTNGIVKERLSRPDTKKGFILDGYPRTIEQAEALKVFAKELNRPIQIVIDVAVSPDVLKERLSSRYICSTCGATYNKLTHNPKVPGTCDRCGGHEFYQREDDKPETVENRLKVNIKMNTPLLDFYRKEGILEEVNGDAEIDTVFASIKQILDKIKD